MKRQIRIGIAIALLLVVGVGAIPSVFANPVDGLTTLHQNQNPKPECKDGVCE
jgi:hypothetical protein